MGRRHGGLPGRRRYRRHVHRHRAARRRRPPLHQEGLVHRRRLCPRDRRRAGGAARGDRRSTAPSIAELLHGTTVASNAILEHKGAHTGLITTKGFRDVLEIRNLRMPRLYDMSWTKPPPLVERRLRVEVDERVNADGGVDRPLDPASVERAVRSLARRGRRGDRGLPAALLRQPGARAADQGDRRAPRARSDPLASAPRCCRRSTSTSAPRRTVINAYVRPIVARYLARLIDELAARGISAPLLLMQSNGGLTTARAAAGDPMHIIESGPGRRRGRRAGAGAADRHRQGDLVRHGRHHRQGRR